MEVEVGAPLAEKFSEHSKLGMEISWVQYVSIKGTRKKKRQSNFYVRHSQSLTARTFSKRPPPVSEDRDHFLCLKIQWFSIVLNLL